MKTSGWLGLALLGLIFGASPSLAADAQRFAFPAMDGWTLAGQPQVFSPDTLYDYINGGSDTAQVEYRVIRLLGIIDALRTTYPTNPLMASRWIKTPHKRLDNRTPLHAMLQHGGEAVTAVVAELDCTYAWDLSGSLTR